MINLPTPQVIETIEYEAILADLVADAKARFLAAGVDYDVGNLETDPVKIALEVAAYREVLLRARINDAAKANLVAFAKGVDLDHLAAFYDEQRLSGETDEALRERVILAISGRSTAGPRNWYRRAARRASIRVKDAAVYRIGKGPDLRVAVLATDNFGEPDAALLDAVRLAVQSDETRAISDRIEIVAATSTTINVTADVWLLPEAPQTVFTELEATLRAALTEEGGFGFNAPRSWITAKLHRAGVARVLLNSPMVDAVVDDNAAPKFGAVALTYKGRER